MNQQFSPLSLSDKLCSDWLDLDHAFHAHKGSIMGAFMPLRTIEGQDVPKVVGGFSLHLVADPFRSLTRHQRREPSPRISPF